MMLSERIKSRALEGGFDVIGIAPARKAPRAEAFEGWLRRGYHGSMHWLEKDPARRADPRRILEGARSVVVVGLSYFIQDPDPELWNDPLRGRIARYAWGPDYHGVMEPMLKSLADFIREESGDPKAATRYYVDTGPVLEREVGWQAGLGFIGKHTLLIHPGLGSYLFLGEVLTNLELDYDEPAADTGASVSMGAMGDAAEPTPAPHPTEAVRCGTVPSGEGTSHSRTASCGNCVRCREICPTNAFPAPYVLDGNRCISYLTIEHKEAIPEAMRPLMKNWVFGCDECQEVCPWVRQFSQSGRTRFLEYDPDFASPRLEDLLALDEAAFREKYRKTPMARTKRRGLLRNAAVVLGNSRDRTAVPVLEKAARDQEPLVKAHAEWAMRQILQNPD